MPNATHDGRQRRRLVLCCVGTFLLASTLRLTFVTQVHSQWKSLPPDSASSRQISFINPYSPSYLGPARAVLAGNILRAGSLSRPPGYPLFLATFGVRNRPILSVQALLGAAMAVGILLIAYTVTGRLDLAVAAGTISAVSPTGIGLTGVIMSDVLFAFLVMVGVGLLVAAGRQQSRWLLYGAGGVFGLSAMVKPMLLLWSSVAAVMLWLLAGGTVRILGRRALVHFFALNLTPIALWSLRNLVADGVFTLSSSGVITTRHYLMSRAEAWAELGRSPTIAEMRQWRSVASEHGRSIRPVGQRLKAYGEEIRTIARMHPRETVLAYALNTKENLAGGWNWLEHQLPHRGTVFQVAAWASRWEGRARAVVPLLLLATLLLTGLRWRRTGLQDSRRSFLDACAMIMAWGYFVVLGGMTYWHGPRHMHPTSVAVLVTIAIGVASMLTPVRIADSLS